MQKSKISVIIPVYNAEQTVGRILDKLITQKYENIEIITVNDGSKDGSLKVLKTYAKKDKRVVVIDQKNAGASAARNVGIKKATGEYITFIDSDDDISKKLISELGKYISSGVDFVVCGMTINGRIITANEVYLEGKKDITRYVLKSLLTKNLLYGPCCKLFKTSIIKQGRIEFPVDIKYGEDTIFVLMYLQNIEALIVINKTLYSYNLQTTGLASLYSTYLYYRCARAQVLRKFVFGNNPKLIDHFFYILLRLRWWLAYKKSTLRIANV